jgi:hypothetical protein
MKGYLGWNWDDGAKDFDNLNYNKPWTSGTAFNEAEAVYKIESATILDAASVTFDLTALTRTVLGDTLNTVFVTIKAILIVNESTSGGELVVGAAASNEWSEPFGADGDTGIVPLDSPWLWASRRCGKFVDASNKNLKLAAVGGDVTYSMAIIGTITGATGECSSSS